MNQPPKKELKFIHIADLHIDAWREKELKVLNYLALREVFNKAKQLGIDFVLISGDVFHVSMPDLNAIRFMVKELTSLVKQGIEVFVIPGSHDLSSDDNSFLYVFEDSGLIKITSNAEKHDEGYVLLPTVSDKLGVVVYGVMGLRNSLDKDVYENLVALKGLDEYEGYFKIFQFHIGVDELLPKSLEVMNTISISLLPKGLNYYAGGHIHKRVVFEKDGAYYVYPGPVYVDSVSELEDLKGVSSYVYGVATYENGKWRVELKHEKFVMKEVVVVDVNLDALSPESAQAKIFEELKASDLKDKIVLLKAKGMVDGLVSRIDFNAIKDYVMSQGAYVFKKNTSKLYSRDVVDVGENQEHKSIEEIEESVMKEILKTAKYDAFDAMALSKNLMTVLQSPKSEDETQATYFKRVVEKAEHIIEEAINESDAK